MNDKFSRRFWEVVTFPELKYLNRDLLQSVIDPLHSKTEYVADALRSHVAAESSRLRLIIDEQEQMALRMRDALHNTPPDSDAHKWAEMMVAAYLNQPEQVYPCQISEGPQDAKEQG